ncbi:hypothetical protein [Paenibacillus hexagrammi]|uniref:Uncharacterized protein n=1 Tax=Paenibacillus hexagrammi TaxID=2908839 RepID=A0ABY3SS15_9BACL|nr:hypothetical protein [Paenibacillus sp. YPD9-1]UJF35772.1 hypothetical protein L0M14_12180 [Paenibacillus sp. YPD9-1]
MITVGFGLGANAIESHGLLWYEDGEWQAEPYPQAPMAISEQRGKQLQDSPYCSGNVTAIHQKDEYAAVVYALGLGTHPGQEVHLLKRTSNGWTVAWAPTYPDWSELWDARVDMTDDISAFTVHRSDMKKIRNA